nr:MULTISPECIES: DUF4157 domain-containing protein [unclassified Streptomyces]
MRAHASGSGKEPAGSPSRGRTRAAAPARPAGAPRALDSRSALALQRALGNAAVTRLLEEERERQEESARPGGAEAAPDVQRSAVQNVLRAPGRPLDAALKDDMESRFDADFSDVRLHTGAAARDSAAEIGARAYTSGSHIVIGDEGGDQHTLAHELTHVIQQRTGPVSGTEDGTGLRISDPSDRYEREAEANASRVLSRPPAHSPAAESAGHASSSPDTAATVQRRPREKPAEEEGDHTHVDPDYPGLRLTLDQALTDEYYETIFKLGGSEERVIFDGDGSFGYIKVDEGLQTYYSLVSGDIGAQEAQANLSGHFSPQRDSSYHVRANGKQFQDARIDSLQDFEAEGVGPGQLVEVSVALLGQASGRAETVAGGLVESRLANATTGMRNSAALDPIKIRVTSSGISISDGNHRLAAATREGHAYAPCMIV